MEQLLNMVLLGPLLLWINTELVLGTVDLRLKT